MLKGTLSIIFVALLAIFASVDEAAMDGLRRAVDICPKTVECGGVVYKTPEGYVRSPLVQGTPFTVDLAPLLSESMVADFHTHICSPHNRVFSPFFSEADTIANQGLHDVGYMYSYCNHRVTRFDPSQDDALDEEVDFHSGKVIYLTNGHIVGFIP